MNMNNVCSKLTCSQLIVHLTRAETKRITRQVINSKKQTVDWKSRPATNFIAKIIAVNVLRGQTALCRLYSVAACLNQSLVASTRVSTRRRRAEYSLEVQRSTIGQSTKPSLRRFNGIDGTRVSEKFRSDFQFSFL